MKPTFQQIVAKLNDFWAKQGCIISSPYDIEKGAGTFNPATFLRCLGPEPFKAAYIEPCRRPKDGRYGTNPNRLQHYFQYQVILKPSPYNIQDLYLQSLEAIGLPLKEHDIRFVHDDWESPTLGASGLGWEVWIDGQECTQFTYFQSFAGIPVHPVTGEITYGIERLAMYLQHVDSIFDIQWNEELTYGDLYSRNEVEWSTYNFEASDPKMWLKHFEDYKQEAKKLVSMHLPIPAYDFVIKASHAFNMLDARGVISVTERASFIAQIRDLAKLVAESYIESRKKQGFPLLNKLPSTLKMPIAKPFRKKTSLHRKPDNFILEIGVEELPATFVPIGIERLTAAIKKLLDTTGISYTSITGMGTPRRLAVKIEELAPRKKAAPIEKRGPSLEHAYNPDGSLKAAGEGFFRSLNKKALRLSDLAKDPEITVVDMKGTKYLVAKTTEPPIETTTLLQNELGKLILHLEFPKTMRWADLEISFARPIRWLLAIYGKDPLQFHFGPIKSSNISYGHRQLAPKAITIDSASNYEKLLQKSRVLVDVQKRRTEITRQVQKLEKTQDFTILEQERVIRQVLHLVEWPYLTVAEFDRAFLKAPQEVLISEMVEHQKYFPVSNQRGELLNYFVITANIDPTDSIRRGNRKVISARLADGVFLYEQDLKKQLETFNEKLKGMIFQKGLGTMYDKVVRLQQEAHEILAYVPLASSGHVERAITLAKADLGTEMVGEFPELQGQMGRIYAQKQGEEKEVAIAIDEQWMPRGEGAELPKTPCGIVLSLTDKIDNLLSFFALNLKPTSSADPYALRRQALGLARIVIAYKIHLPLRTVLKKCLSYFPKELNLPHVIEEVVNFVITRAKSVLQDKGFSKEEIEACIIPGIDDVYDLYLRVEALHQFRKTNTALAQLFEVHKRCQGQIQGLPSLAFDAEKLVEKEEQELFSYLQKIEKPFKEKMQSYSYQDALVTLASVQPKLAALFDHVKILSDDEKLKTNRLALLQRVGTLFNEIADFQKIPHTTS